MYILKYYKIKELVNKETIGVHIALKALALSKPAYYYKPNPANDSRKRKLDNTLIYKLKKLTRGN